MGFCKSQYNQMAPKQLPCPFLPISSSSSFFSKLRSSLWTRSVSGRGVATSEEVQTGRKWKTGFSLKKGGTMRRAKKMRTNTRKLRWSGCWWLGGREEEGGRLNTWKEGEINLAGSGLSKVVIIAGGEMMIALTRERSLRAAKACSCAHVHAQTHPNPTGILLTRVPKVTQTHTHSHTYRSSQISEPMQWCLFENGIFHHFRPFHWCRI